MAAKRSVGFGVLPCPWRARARSEVQAVARDDAEQEGRGTGDFVVVSAPTMTPGVAHASDGNRAGGAVIVMLPAVTPAELVQTVRGLLDGVRS